MTTSRVRASARAQAEAMIATLREAAPGAVAELRRSALAAHALALRAGSRVLEAEALLLLGRSLTPTGDPRHTLQSLQKAGRIFVANGLVERALVSQVGCAMALYELGEDRNAIALAQAAIGHAQLPPAERAAAYVVAALAQGHLGEVDEALALLETHALPLARASAPRWLLARVQWARVRTLWLVRMHHCAPGLWRGLPVAPDLLQVQAPPPDTAALLADLREVQDNQPPGQHWPFIDILRALVQGLSGEAGAPTQAAQTLRDIHANHSKTDPPTAAWALFFQAMMWLEARRPEATLLPILHAKAIARSAQMHGLLRDLLLIQSRAQEALQDSRSALASYKAFVMLQLKSTRLSLAPEVLPPIDDKHPAPLRDLEAPHVRRALRYIEAHLREPLAVGDVVAHVQVARRTLETAFKQNKGCTIASYIKRRRLELASEALVSTNLPMAELAQSVGFGSVARFAQDFAARYGVPPSLWRRRSHATEAP